MSVSDPIGDFIIQLKNAGAVRKERVLLPYSEFKMAVAQKLKEAGYVLNVEKKGKKIKKMLEIELSYEKEGAHKVRGVKRISKPGRRVYRRAEDLHPVRFGYGSLILSTPRGVKTNEEARKEQVGGEVLFEIW